MTYEAAQRAASYVIFGCLEFLLDSLLRPGRVGANGYRYYGEAALLRLQQILFYKELGLSLEEIAEVLDEPGFDVARALEAHRRALRQRLGRLRRLITTVDETIARWHQHLRYFFEPSAKMLRGLGRLYHDDPQFNATFVKLDPRLAPFMAEAIEVYCQKMEK